MEAASTNGSDSHGDAVASAARNCPHAQGDVHGDCVSSVARQNEGADNNQTGKATAPAWGASLTIT